MLRAGGILKSEVLTLVKKQSKSLNPGRSWAAAVFESCTFLNSLLDWFLNTVKQFVSPLNPRCHWSLSEVITCAWLLLNRPPSHFYMGISHELQRWPNCRGLFSPCRIHYSEFSVEVWDPCLSFSLSLCQPFTATS